MSTAAPPRPAAARRTSRSDFRSRAARAAGPHAGRRRPRRRLRDHLAAQPGSRRPPVPRPAVPRRGLRGLEQLVVLGPSHRRLQRAVPGRVGGAHAAARRRDRRHRHARRCSSPLARRHFGPDAWLGAVLFGAATATNLYTGRLAFAFGALPALGAVVGARLPPQQARLRAGVAVGAVQPGGGAVRRPGRRRLRARRLLERAPVRGAPRASVVGVAALAPVGLIAIAFPEGGSEPFGFPTHVPGAGAWRRSPWPPMPKEHATLRAGVLVYVAATLARLPGAVADRQQHRSPGHVPGAPLAALLWWRRRPCCC